MNSIPPSGRAPSQAPVHLGPLAFYEATLRTVLLWGGCFASVLVCLDPALVDGLLGRGEDADSMTGIVVGLLILACGAPACTWRFLVGRSLLWRTRGKAIRYSASNRYSVLVATGPALAVQGILGLLAGSGAVFALTLLSVGASSIIARSHGTSLMAELMAHAVAKAGEPEHPHRDKREG